MALDILLVRHGVTSANIERRYEGKGDSLLSEEGLEQALELACRLSTLDISKVYSSPRRRCIQTAQSVARCHNVPVRIVAGLEEADFGVWEGLTFDEIEKRDPDLVSRWIEDPIRISPPEGETLEEMAQRVFRAYDHICALSKGRKKEAVDTSKHQKIVIVTHGGPIRALLSRIEKGNLSSFWDYPVPPCSVTEVRGTVLFASP